MTPGASMGFSPVTSVDAPYKAAAMPRLTLLGRDWTASWSPIKTNHRIASDAQGRVSGLMAWVRRSVLSQGPSALRARIDQARYRHDCDATGVLSKATARRHTSKGTGASRAYNGPKTLVKSGVTLCSDIACIQLRSALSDRGALRTETAALVRRHTIASPRSSSVSDTYISRASSSLRTLIYLATGRPGRIVVPPRRQYRDS